MSFHRLCGNEAVKLLVGKDMLTAAAQSNANWILTAVPQHRNCTAVLSSGYENAKLIYRNDCT